MSLFLVGVSLAVGLLTILCFSIAWAAFYLLLSLVCVGSVLYAYCAKCPCRSEGCGHVVPGMLARKFPPRQTGPYTGADYLATAVSLLLLFGFPQPWLLARPAAFWLFWGVAAVGLIEIVFFVCRRCRNEHCPMCRLRNTPS